MFALLLAYSVYGIAAGAENNGSVKTGATSDSRDWTDASGTRHVQAVLLRIEGDKLWFRRSDGKLTTTSLSRLSSADRQYVATKSKERIAQSNAARAAAKIRSKVQSMIGLPGWTIGSQPANPKRVVPAAMVYVRLSGEFLEDYVEREVRRKKPVRDNILGARIVGESVTRGKTSLELLPSKGQLLGKITFTGTVHSQTRGYKGPVVLHQFSDSTFRSSKLVSLDENGLRVSRATTHAATDLTTTCIETCLPRLRGRIARRIAWNRVSGSQQQSQSITAQHTAAQISSDLDERIGKSTAKVEQVFKSKLPELDDQHQLAGTEMRFRSSADCAEFAMVRREANTEERKIRPPIVEGNPDVAVRVHRAMLTRAISDPQVRDDLAPRFVELLKARFQRNAEARRKVDNESPTDTTKWTFDPDWLVLDFIDSSH
jgi:hypothetical protein